MIRHSALARRRHPATFEYLYITALDMLLDEKWDDVPDDDAAPDFRALGLPDVLKNREKE